MEEKLVELVASKVAPLVIKEGINAYSKHVEKKKSEQVETGKTTREALGVINNSISTMERIIEPMATLSEQQKYEEAYVKSSVREAQIEMIKNSEELSVKEKNDMFQSVEKEDIEIKREAAKISEMKEIRKWGCNMATLGLAGGIVIKGLEIVYGGGGATLPQNSSGNRRVSMQHSGNSHKHISGPRYNTLRLASR